MPRVDAGTALYGVVGWPLRQTLSPLLHNSAFTALGIPAVYVPLPVEPARSGELASALLTLGIRGANITVPHKEAAFEQCVAWSPDARAARSVNTLVRGPRGWKGHTTDGDGFVDFLGAAGLPREKMSAVVLGAGGASRSLVVALARRPGVRLRVVTRDPRAAAAGLRGLDRIGKRSSLEFLRRGSEGAARAIRASGLVINATSLGGKSGGPLPCPTELVSPGAAAVDLIYGSPTPWLRALRRRERMAFSGLGMLIHQAARSFELWTGRKSLTWMRWTGGWEDELERSGARRPAPGPPGRARR